MTGQYYLRVRFYNPVVGRFTQEDTYRGDGLNLYAYCRNNHVRYWDPKGYAKLAKAGEDLYVGTYSKSRYANKKSGLLNTHTPHHAVQDAVSKTSHGKGITVNLRKDLHEKTETCKKLRNFDPNDLRKHIAADIYDLRKILEDARYSRDVINTQL
ncbi:RHS repeat-associated core domain-containing protein [Clostridium saccharobutylicum]|uniref:RHS repeat-associated core domain-containing protein n=1 Tax=Clostridium saccharobutylicum TaxID=169679 RepID=UPI001FA81E3D